MKTQLAAIAAAWIFLSGLCSAETLHWTEVNELVSSDMQTFRQLFQNAHTTGFGITILGDSQETAGNAAGRYYIPSLGDQFYQYYGNVPKTGIVTGRNQSSSWISAADSAGELNSDTEYALPSVIINRYSSMSFENGLLAQATADGYTSPFLPAPKGGYFNGHPLEVELIVRTRPNSGEAFWKALLTRDDRRSYSGGEEISSGVTHVNADQNKIEFVSAYLGTFDLKDHNAIQIIARSANENRLVDLAGVRFTNSVDQSGIGIQTLSKGGNTANRLLQEHSEAESLFKLLAGDDVVAIQFGTNDARTGTSAEEFKESLRAVISRVRNWSGDESLPIIIISDPDFAYPTILRENIRTNYDLYPGVSAELATELKNVLALNTRLIAHRNNWFVGSSEFDSFSDGIHYTQLGSEMLAKWQVDSLLELAAPLEPRINIRGTQGDDFVTFDPVAREVSVNGVITHIRYETSEIHFYSGGGNDYVVAIGDPEQEEFAVLQGTRMTVRADDYLFAAHNVVELEFDSSSGSDICLIIDSEAEERLTSTPTSVRLVGEDSLLQATDVGQVYVFSSGGDDSARMRGGLESERMNGSMQNRLMRMTGNDFFVSLSGFETVNANGGIGENDFATIVDSNQLDIAYFRGDFGRIINDTTDYSVRSFERVNFASTSGNDIGIFQETLDSTVAGNGIWETLVGPDFKNTTYGLDFLSIRKR